ncbi:MAG: arginine--tRNA ligase [bacterium]|nr:arginine--tRNA ligase [bacterium]
MFRAQIREEIEKLVPKGTVFSVERPENSEHGDYSSNIALVLAKKIGNPPAGGPKEVAEWMKATLGSRAPKLGKIIERIESAGPGFLNFFIAREALVENLSIFSRRGERFSEREGVGAPGERVKTERNGKRETSKKINIEFISANPTGPLTMANGRGGFYGDALANVLSAVGRKVTREYYINDAGNQIKLLGESILAAEGKIPAREELYKGEYIKKLKEKTAAQAAASLLKEIKVSLIKAGIKFDVWYSEDKNLHKKNELKKILTFLNKKKVLHEKEGALWLADAVVIKSNKESTYFLADLAYHYDKFMKRKFDIAIDIWGADHHGYIERMKKGVEAIGVEPARLQIIIMQLVRLISGGKEVKMSKRSGEFVTLDELLKEVGVDAARWFFLERSPNTHMDFDMDLAKERSKKNPVYYVQYAHARSCSILRKGKPGKKADLMLLDKPEELALIKKILQLHEIIEDITDDYQAHRLTKYVYELAQTFTNFYEKCLVIDTKNKELTQARLALVSATKKTLKQTLTLMGIAAPEKM